MMNGAFFGPSAEQVGGVFAITRPEGTLLFGEQVIPQLGA